MQKFDINTIQKKCNILISSNLLTLTNKLITKLLAQLIDDDMEYEIVVLSEYSLYNLSMFKNVKYVITDFSEYIDSLKHSTKHYFIIYNTMCNAHILNGTKWLEKANKCNNVTNIIDQPFYIDYDTKMKNLFNYVFMFNRISGLTKKKTYEQFFYYTGTYEDYDNQLQQYCKSANDFLFCDCANLQSFCGNIDDMVPYSNIFNKYPLLAYLEIDKIVIDI